MVVNRNFIERSIGAKLLVEFCENLADELNIELAKEPYWVLAAKEDALENDYCKLIIQASTDSVMVSLSREEIENFQINISRDKLEAKLKNKFETLKC